MRFLSPVSPLAALLPLTCDGHEASNASDWQRNATKPNDPILGKSSPVPDRGVPLSADRPPRSGQLIGFPLSNFIVQVIGMLVASTSEVVYGEVVWNPVIYLERLLVDNFDAAHRAGAFFIAAGFVYSLLFSVSPSWVRPEGCSLTP